MRRVLCACSSPTTAARLALYWSHSCETAHHMHVGTRINRRLQYDFNIGRMLISVTSAVLGSASAATTIVAMSSGCSSSSGL